jgi:hypothetical protein
MKNITTETVKTVIRKTWEESSLLSSAEWCEGDLTIEFKGGQRYKYSEVSLDEFTNFSNAESGGKYFSAEIRGIYETEKIEE